MLQSGVHLPLRGVAAEVGHQAHAEGVGTLPPFYHAQVAGCLCQALPEAQAAIILSQRVSLKVSWERQKSQEVGCRRLMSKKRCTKKEKRKICYLCHKWHGASSDGPQSFEIFQLFLVWQIPGRKEGNVLNA